MTGSVPPLPTTAELPVGGGRIHDHFPAPIGEGAPLAGPGAPGHVERELLVSGAANVYRYGATTDTIEVDHASSYTTRIISRRPQEGQPFSGTVILEIGHPEIGAGPLWRFCGPLIASRGHAHVLVTPTIRSFPTPTCR